MGRRKGITIYPYSKLVDEYVIARFAPRLGKNRFSMKRFAKELQLVPNTIYKALRYETIDPSDFAALYQRYLDAAKRRESGESSRIDPIEDRNGKRTCISYSKVAFLYRQECEKPGFKMKEFANTLGISIGTVYKALNEQGITIQRKVISEETKKQALALYAQDIPYRAIASELGISIASVSLIVSAQKRLKNEFYGRSQRIPYSEIASLYCQECEKPGFKMKEFANALGISTGTVYKALRNQCVSTSKRFISDETKRKVVNMYRKGKSQRDIAKDTGISTGSVSIIINKHKR